MPLFLSIFQLNRLPQDSESFIFLEKSRVRCATLYLNSKKVETTNGGLVHGNDSPGLDSDNDKPLDIYSYVASHNE